MNSSQLQAHVPLGLQVYDIGISFHKATFLQNRETLTCSGYVISVSGAELKKVASMMFSSYFLRYAYTSMCGNPCLHSPSFLSPQTLLGSHARLMDYYTDISLGFVSFMMKKTLLIK